MSVTAIGITYYGAVPTATFTISLGASNPLARLNKTWNLATNTATII